MHYALSLFNLSHKMSWWVSVGSSKEASNEPDEEALKSLRVLYSRQVKRDQGQHVPKGGDKGKKGDKRGKGD